MFQSVGYRPYADLTERETDLERVTIMLEAQFYRTERYKRLDDTAQKERDKIEKKRWRTDLINELIIIGMIGAEIILSIYGIRLAIAGDVRQSQDVEKQLKVFNDMQTVLSNLRDSSKETAETMKEERKTMEAMKLSLERQVALFYDVQLNLIYDEGKKKLVLINSGRSNVGLYEVIVAGERRENKKFAKPLLTVPGGTQEFELDKFSGALNKELPKEGQRTYTFTFLIKNEKQERFTLTADLVVAWRGNALAFFTQPNTIVPGWKK